MRKVLSSISLIAITLLANAFAQEPIKSGELRENGPVFVISESIIERAVEMTIGNNVDVTNSAIDNSSSHTYLIATSEDQYTNIISAVTLGLRFGAALKQIRANDHTAQTDNPMTRNIQETYRSEIGTESGLFADIHMDSLLSSKSQANIFRSIDPGHRWNVLWENELRHKIWEWIGMIFRFQLAYDESQSKKVQYRQSFSVGVVHRF